VSPAFLNWKILNSTEIVSILLEVEKVGNWSVDLLPQCDCSAQSFPDCRVCHIRILIVMNVEKTVLTEVESSDPVVENKVDYGGDASFQLN
jgi:hypothetical protein